MPLHIGLTIMAVYRQSRLTVVHYLVVDQCPADGRDADVGGLHVDALRPEAHPEVLEQPQAVLGGIGGREDVRGQHGEGGDDLPREDDLLLIPEVEFFCRTYWNLLFVYTGCPIWSWTRFN